MLSGGVLYLLPYRFGMPIWIRNGGTVCEPGSPSKTMHHSTHVSSAHSNNSFIYNYYYYYYFLYFICRIQCWFLLRNSQFLYKEWQRDGWTSDSPIKCSRRSVYIIFWNMNKKNPVLIQMCLCLSLIEDQLARGGGMGMGVWQQHVGFVHVWWFYEWNWCRCRFANVQLNAFGTPKISSQMLSIHTVECMYVPMKLPSANSVHD